MLDKKELRLKFSKEWKKHYNIETLKERGFKRRQCKKCGRYFWSIEEREICGDCEGYTFIGNPSGKKQGYVETWKTIEKYFTEHGHESIKPYPTVARWRDDLYFTIASINLFQPYVVSGELEPIANPLIVPQPCIRFNDVANVGVTGRHYTNFVMIGQHAFNTEKTGLFYWKEEAIGHDIEYLKRLGIKEEEIVFHEDVWVGGGNFGPSMEYFVKGLELGNCVFMQFEETPEGYRELKTKVIDMGAGLSRLAWITNGVPMSYEIVLGPVKKMKRDAGIKIDEELFLRYAKLAASLDIEEVKDVEKEKERIAKILGISKEELFQNLAPLQSIYAIADHTLTLLFTLKDGMLPSNSGGGYNLRMLARRIFAFDEEFNFHWDYGKILEEHAYFLRELFPELKEGVELTREVLEIERKKYKKAKEKAKRKVEVLLKRSKKITAEEVIKLYESDGIPPEYIAEEGKKKGVEVEIPGNFYEIISKKGEKEKDMEEEKVDVSNFPKTQLLFYDQPYLAEFKAKILGNIPYKGKNAVILDRTAFYPEGGGQVGDIGWIGEERVINTKKVEGVVLHITEKPVEGREAIGRVDIKRRKQITRNHTAAHLLNAASRKVLGIHAWQAGAYKDEHIAHLDITHYKRITDEELNEMEKLVNKWIMDNLPIEVEILPRNIAEAKYGMKIYQGGAVPGKELRIVKIGDVDVEACGGTHNMLKSTGEIGFFKIVKRESVKDGIERVIYVAGEAAVDYVQKREELIKKVAEIFNVEKEQIPKAAERFFTEWKEQRKEIEKLKEKIAQLEVEKYIHESIAKNKVVFLLGDYDIATMQKMADTFAKHERAMVIIMNKRGNFVTAAGKKAKYNALQLANMVIEKLGGKGGGKPTIAFGKVEKIEKIEI